MDRYPEDTEISIDDFRNCDWATAISGSGKQDYSSMWQSLTSFARKAIDENKLSKGKALWLLADACSMKLVPSSINEPFKPFSVIYDKRSALPEDFGTIEVAILAEFAKEIAEPLLCARISDISWLLQKPRDPEHALLAIDSYRKVGINRDSWVRDGRACWERSIILCRMLKTGAGDRLQEIEAVLLDVFTNSCVQDGYLAIWIYDLLSKHDLGRSQQVKIANKLEQLATDFDESGDLHRTRDYFGAAAEAFRKAGSEEKFAEMTVKSAEEWVKEAIARQSSGSPSNMMAVNHYENAIQELRSIPRIQRANYDVDNRIENLRAMLSSAGEKSLEEMQEMTSPGVDISKLVNNAVDAVKGKSALDAFASFASIYRGANVQEIRKFSEKLLNEHPIQAMFPLTHISSDGRVIAKRPGAGLENDDNEATVWPEMVKHYGMELGLVVQGSIWPALGTVQSEHRLQEIDFLSIVRKSPIVPPDRYPMFAKAIFAGYDNDFVSALHILVPQIENLIRFHLKQNGVKTTNLDQKGIENENGLSALAELPEVAQIFGADLAFEIKALFCDSFGPNLRNELAHGLLGYEESNSVYSIYAWWLGLRIVFNTFWNAKHAEEAGTD